MFRSNGKEEIMGSLMNIVEQCEENEREYERRGEVSRDRDINLGWLEASRFFFSNFDITEKTINE